jgi:hypothetical protein
MAPCLQILEKTFSKLMPAAGQIQFLEVSISSLEVNQEPPLAFKS